jgi:hypothetical protein
MVFFQSRLVSDEGNREASQIDVDHFHGGRESTDAEVRLTFPFDNSPFIVPLVVRVDLLLRLESSPIRFWFRRLSPIVVRSTSRCQCMFFLVSYLFLCSLLRPGQGVRKSSPTTQKPAVKSQVSLQCSKTQEFCLQMPPISDKPPMAPLRVSRDRSTKTTASSTAAKATASGPMKVVRRTPSTG